jgi:hypothetical protein
VPPPDHLVATITEVYTPDEGIFGAFSPSNIIEREGYYYAFLKLQTYPFGDQHTCLMRPTICPTRPHGGIGPRVDSPGSSPIRFATI